MSTPFLATAALAATSIVSLAGLAPPAAAAQGGEDWFFCYAESPTYGSGTYVYTRTQYAGANLVPKGEIATAIAREVPQAQGRDVTCWRYPTQAIAEAKRTQGMTMDKGRGYTVHVLNWSSPYTYVPAPVAVAPVAEVDELAPAETPPTVAVTAAPDAPLPAAMAPAAPAASDAPDAPRALTYDEEFALKKAEWQRQVDENTRKQAAYAIQLAAEQQRAMEAAAAVEDARRDYERQLEQQRAQYEAEQAAWKADVAACEAGEVARCAKPETPAAAE